MSTVGALVSAFYCEKYLRARLDNLLGQTSRPKILAVCLRGSAEHRILSEYRVPVVSTMTVPTIYGAWNKLLDVASTDYLVVANSDDSFYPHAIQRMQEALDDHPEIALVYPNADIVEEYGSGIPVGRFELPEFEVESMLELCYMGPMPMWRRSLHEKYGPFDSQMEVAGDYEFWLRAACAGEEFLHIPDSLGQYLSRPDSREHREPIRTLWETARAKSRYTKEPYGPTSNCEASNYTGYSTVPMPGTPRTVESGQSE